MSDKGRADTIAKILILSFNDDEEKAIERVLSVLSDEIGLEPVQAVTSPVLSGQDVYVGADF